MADTTGFHVVRLEPHHILDLRPREMESEVLALAQIEMGELKTFAESVASAPIAYTALDGNQVVACAGIAKLHPGVGEAWSLMCQDLVPGKPSRKWVAVRQAMRMGIESAFDTGYHRVQATISVHFPRADAWMRGLGLDNNGRAPHLLEQWGPDRSDHWLYAKTKEREDHV